MVLCLTLFANTRDQLGDVNNDGIVNVLDIVRIVNIILENDPPPTDYELWASDVNADGFVNVQDIVIMVIIIMQTYDCPDLYSPCFDNLSNCCADTTQYEYTWIEYHIGDFGSTILGSKIINNSQIWTMGIIKDDASNFDFTAAIWNGNSLDIRQFIDSTHVLLPYDYSVIISDIYYINEYDMFFASQGIYHWNGQEIQSEWSYNTSDFFDYHVPRKLWGNSDESIYAIGRMGLVVHYNGSAWLTIDAPVDNIYLRDISGSEDGEYIFISGYNSTSGVEGIENIGKSIALQYHIGIWDTLFYSDDYIGNLENGEFGWTFNVDVLGDTAYFTTTHALVKYNYLLDDTIVLTNDQILWWDSTSLSVLSPNDIVILTGTSGTRKQYNGVSWYISNELNNPGYNYWSFDAKEDLIIAGGDDISGFPYFNALIKIGQR